MIVVLAAQIISVSSAQVRTVLSETGIKRRRRGRRSAKVEVVQSTLTLDSLPAAKKLVDQLGNVEAAKTAVDALAKIS